MRDKINKSKLKMLLNNKYKIKHFKKISSTNDYLLKKIKKKGFASFLIVADRQTKGKGRVGKSFYSPKGGIYFSVSLKNANQKTVTPASAAALLTALKEECNIDAKIKWVNDLYFNNLKVAGILAERIVKEDEYIILGVGIDLYKQRRYPATLKGKIGFIKDKKEKDLKTRIIAKMLNLLPLYMENEDLCYKIYKENSFVLNKTVKIRGREYVAMGIDRNFHLLAEDETGNAETIKAGEIEL